MRLCSWARTLIAAVAQRIRAGQASESAPWRRPGIERLRAWAEDEQAKRHHAEEQLVNARSEIARLQAQIARSYPQRCAAREVR